MIRTKQRRMYFYVTKKLNIPNANVRYNPAAYKKQISMRIFDDVTHITCTTLSQTINTGNSLKTF